MNSFPESWAPDSDALIAAPKHHKLLFANEFARVLDTNIPAREKTAAHTHQYPASLYILSLSDFMRYDAGGNVIGGFKKNIKSPRPSIDLMDRITSTPFLRKYRSNGSACD